MRVSKPIRWILNVLGGPIAGLVLIIATRAISPLRALEEK